MRPSSIGSEIDNCPMRVVRQIIGKAAEMTVKANDAPLQMQIVRRIMEDIYGGTWGVLIIKDPELISTAVHWTFPDHRHRDGSAAFCLHVENGWQYNVFKTGDHDTDDRLTVEQVLEQISRNNTTNSKTKRGSAIGDEETKKVDRQK